jgi:phosphatidylinositol alpha-1,6-mannosyltransferase
MASTASVPLSIELLPNAVNADRFSAPGSDDVRARFGLPASGPLVLSVGHMKERKGFDGLVLAFKMVHADVTDAHLAVVGPGDSSSLRKQIAELGLGDVVHLLGEVGEAELVSLYQTCDLFALLPRVDQGHFEGFGLVFLEANACGKPVVGTRSGGVPDAIVDGETGLLVDEDDARDAAAAMLRILTDDALAARLGDAGRRWANEHSWAAYADRLVTLYRAALEPNAPRSRAD